MSGSNTSTPALFNYKPTIIYSANSYVVLEGAPSVFPSRTFHINSPALKISNTLDIERRSNMNQHGISNKEYYIYL